jgi:glycosyltransferase involved in cell wall biosynthesis
MPTSGTGRTSIITPVRNGVPFIAQAIESALPQLHAADELLVIDDHSTDATVSVVSSFDDPRIRLLSSPRVGVSAARNEGLAVATGEFVVFLDADDEWLPGRHDALLRHLAAHPEIDAVFGRIRVKREPGAPDRGYGAVDGHFFPNGGVLGTGMFRRDIVQRGGGFAEDMLAAGDVDFFNRLQEVGMKIGAIECDALLYRRHASNMTNDRDNARRWFMEMLRRKIARGRLRGSGEAAVS